MSYEFYKWLHVSAFALLLLSLGGLTVGGFLKAPDRLRKRALMFNGVALVLLFVAGFGLIAKGGFSWGFWLYTKISLWLVFGLLPFFIKRFTSKAPYWMFLILILSFVMVGLGVWKPYL